MSGPHKRWNIVRITHGMVYVFPVRLSRTVRVSVLVLGIGWPISWVRCISTEEQAMVVEVQDARHAGPDARATVPSSV